MNLIVGMKVQTYEQGEVKIYRVCEIHENGDIRLIGPDGMKYWKKEKEMSDVCVQITPDAFMNIMITDYLLYPDVYICVSKATSTFIGKQVPDIILRQCIYNNFKNMIANNNTIYLGDCICESNNMTGVDMSKLFEFEKIEYDTAIALYVNDTVDDIEAVVDVETKEQIASALGHIHAKQALNAMVTVEGIAHTFKELLTMNNFIAVYRQIFNIMQVEWPVILGEQSYNESGDIILNEKQIKAIEDIIRKYITNVKVIEYDKDIDVCDIVAYSHIMISDATGTIYLIAYQPNGDYPIDDDIAAAMNI